MYFCIVYLSVYIYTHLYVYMYTRKHLHVPIGTSMAAHSLAQAAAREVGAGHAVEDDREAHGKSLAFSDRPS